MKDVDTSGPVFDGRADRALNEFVKDSEKEIAEKTKRYLIEADHRSFRNETGYYTSRIHIENVRGAHTVTDGGVVYGPWLEGTGSRNAPVTVFRGYHNVQQVSAKVQLEAAQIAERMLPKYKEQMG